MQVPKFDTFLTFEVLDDSLGLSKHDQVSYLSRHRINEIGPLVEHLFLIDGAHQRITNRESPLVSDLYATFDSSPLLSQAINFENTPGFHEFTRCPQSNNQTDDVRWQMFCRRFRNAGRSAGFRNEFVSALTGTIDELAGNIIEHSHNAMSAIAGYRWSPCEFEFVIGDAGIGSLESLRTHPHYSWLLDAGQALETMIKDGESSKGPNLGCGTGFHALVHNIASENSIVRFRSGDHCLSIDGTSSNPITRVAQRNELTGLVVSSRSLL